MAPYLSQLGKLHVASSVVCAGMAEKLFSSLALSYSHYSASTSCLVDPPILPAWPISVLLKYMIDRIQRQLSVNQSHTSYVLRGYLFWGVKLTYTVNRQEGSLVAGAGAGSRSRDQAPEPRGPDPDLLLFLKEKYTTPQWAGISAAMG